LFVQGGGAEVHDQWDDKLAGSLQRELGPGYDVRYPRMPNESDPHYADWKTALLGHLDRLEDGAILAGHSIGGAILINVLAEVRLTRRVGGIFLVATPFVGEGGWPSDEIRPRPDLGAHLPAGVPVFFYEGAADETVPFAHVELYAKAVPQAVVRVLEHADHQLNNDMSAVVRDIRAISDGKPPS